MIFRKVRMMETFFSINPKDETVFQEHHLMSEREIDSVLESCYKEYSSWKHTSFSHRSQLLNKLAEELISNEEQYARMITDEMGKVIKESIAEIRKCVSVCKYYSESGEQFLTSQYIETEAGLSYIAYRPIGVVLGIMPWNFPFWQVFRYAVPTLMAGNTCLLKHAPNVCASAILIEKAFRNAGFPEDVFRSAIIDTDQTGLLIDDARIAAVTITGSTRAGKSVASRAGKALKKTVMELGGSDPYIILKDAHVEKAVDSCVTSRLINGGQSCIAAKRFIVEAPVYDDFVSLFKELMNSKHIGDPLTDVDLGPMARKDLRDDLHTQVEKTVGMGANCILGGQILEGLGFYYPPTILVNVTKEMPAYNEELFGPVATIIKVLDETEAIQVANDTALGLGAAVFTEDLEKGRDIAENQLEAGCCFVNQFVSSDPRLPFGGIKDSGYGRELGPLGIREFVNAKTVLVK